MSKMTGGLSEADVAQTTKNIALVRQFLREVVADPSRLGEMPSGATVVLLPSDDPAQLTANLALAEQAAREGRKDETFTSAAPAVPPSASAQPV